MHRHSSSLKTSFKDYPNLVSIALLRWLERVLSPGTFYALLRPILLVRAAVNNAFKKTTPPPPMPDFLRTPRTYQTRIRQRAELYRNDVLLNFPDRLAAPKWLARCRIDGLEHLQAARQNGRPVVLAYFHFGAFPIMHCWGRGGLGLPFVALVGGNAGMRTQRSRLQDRLLPLPELPIALYPEQLRELAKFLVAGNLLYIAVDAPTGKQMDIPFCDGWDFRMATGAIRFASRHQAELIACTIADEGDWRYHITFSRPVPKELLAAETDGAGAGKFLVDEMMPVFKTRPDQCLDAMTRRLIKKPDVKP